jgi:hypothetical protein
MKKIYKYPIEITDEQEIQIPLGSEIMHAGLDPLGNPCIWVMVDVNECQSESVTVFVVGTGHPMPHSYNCYAGTFVHGPFVWHVFLCLN